MTVSIHELAADVGCEHLTWQVAAGDSTELGATTLADYDGARGEACDVAHQLHLSSTTYASIYVGRRLGRQAILMRPPTQAVPLST